ncbi:MAG TPA: hypothetical protein VKV36_00515 [Acidimicrobiales bacterium]|nr:hypothetical protein [Acidimicrobiales bacterium]
MPPRRPDLAEIANALYRLLADIDSGAMPAPAAVRHRLEGAALAFTAAAEGRIPTVGDLLAILWDGGPTGPPAPER